MKPNFPSAIGRKKPKTLSGIETSPLFRSQGWYGGRRKKPKTLSGIETPTACILADRLPVGKNLKPYQGLKPGSLTEEGGLSFVGKNLKPYQGLKRRTPIGFQALVATVGKNLKPYQGLKLAGSLYFGTTLSRKKPKTLSGIETCTTFPVSATAASSVGKNLKPYQGLKLTCIQAAQLNIVVGKNLKPYQGLKQAIADDVLASFIKSEKT